MTEIAIKDLEELCHKALRKAGLDEQNAIDTTEHYLENEISGKASHGLVRVIRAVEYMHKHSAPTTDPSIEHDIGNMVRINANRQIGAVAAKKAMKLSIERGKKHGLALIGVRNYIASTGSMAFYLRRIAEAGLIAIIGCNSVAMVAPPTGKKRVLGTNPFGIAIPSDKQDFIGDFGTAAIAYGKILVLGEKGEDIPEGLMIDSEGNPSTNPKDAYDGAILPLAGYKGFALGLMIELLAGPLIGAKAVKENLYDNDGLFILVIDPKKMGHNDFNAQISKVLDEIKNTSPADGFDEISLPGERSLKTLQETLKSGKVNVVDNTLEKLYALAK